MIRAAAVLLLGPVIGSEARAQSSPLGQARQVTASYTFDLVPAPDGQRAVMIRIVGGREQLFTVKLDGTGEKQITSADADHEDPVWSPDGRKIAYVLVKGGKKVVHLMNADGTGSVAVTPATQSAIHPAFTPDGKEILYCTDDDLRPPEKNESQIYAVDIASKRVRTLISGGVNTYPVMSPDGRKIAWRKIIGDMNSEVFVADADGSNARNVTNHWSWEGWPAWSPDGRTIAFAGSRNNSYQIFLMDPDGSNVRLLANTEGRGTSPKWSADGRSIFYTVCRRSQDRTGCDIFKVDVAGEGAR